MQETHEMAGLTETDVAYRLGISAQTLRSWRWQRKGPTFLKVGRAVRYRPEDIEAFLEASINHGCVCGAIKGDLIERSQSD